MLESPERVRESRQRLRQHFEVKRWIRERLLRPTDEVHSPRRNADDPVYKPELGVPCGPDERVQRCRSRRRCAQLRARPDDARFDLSLDSPCRARQRTSRT